MSISIVRPKLTEKSELPITKSEAEDATHYIFNMDAADGNEGKVFFESIKSAQLYPCLI